MVDITEGGAVEDEPTPAAIAAAAAAAAAKTVVNVVDKSNHPWKQRLGSRPFKSARCTCSSTDCASLRHCLLTARLRSTSQVPVNPEKRRECSGTWLSRCFERDPKLSGIECSRRAADKRASQFGNEATANSPSSSPASSVRW